MKHNFPPYIYDYTVYLVDDDLNVVQELRKVTTRYELEDGEIIPCECKVYKIISVRDKIAYAKLAPNNWVGSRGDIK